MKEIGVLKIKFENWNFEELFKNGNYENCLHAYLKLKETKYYFKIKKICENTYLKRKVANLFKNGIFSGLKP